MFTQLNTITSGYSKTLVDSFVPKKQRRIVNDILYSATPSRPINKCEAIEH